jgi:hypothetical protein
VKGDPRHPSLQLKKVGDYLVGTSYYQADRALSIEVEDGLLWFWIGAHDAVRAVNQ